MKWLVGLVRLLPSSSLSLFPFVSKLEIWDKKRSTKLAQTLKFNFENILPWQFKDQGAQRAANWLPLKFNQLFFSLNTFGSHPDWIVGFGANHGRLRTENCPAAVGRPPHRRLVVNRPCWKSLDDINRSNHLWHRSRVDVGPRSGKSTKES